MTVLSFKTLLAAVIVVGAFAGPAFAQDDTSQSPQPETQMQCDDSTAYWSLWQAIAENAATPSDAAEDYDQASSPPVFPLPEILAALQAVPLTGPSPDPNKIDASQELYRPGIDEINGDIAKNFWPQTAIYAQAAGLYEQGNFPQAIVAFDAIVKGNTAPLYRAASAYTAARAEFRLGDYADGAKRIAAILNDNSLQEFWLEAWNLIDFTQVGFNIAPLVAADLLQDGRFMITPSQMVCENGDGDGPFEPDNALGGFIAPNPWPALQIPANPLTQPGIDYAKAHDPVVAAQAQMDNPDIDRQNWQRTHNPLWAVSLGGIGDLQDIPMLSEAIAAVRGQQNWPGLTDRARAMLVWTLALDEVRLYALAGEQTKALAALNLPGESLASAFAVSDDNGPYDYPASGYLLPDAVSAAIDGAVNGVTSTLVGQAMATAPLANASALSQRPDWIAARQWAIASSQALHVPVSDALKPLLVANISELYLHPILHLTPDPATGEIRLGVLRGLLDDWSSAQLIALSRQPYVDAQDRQAVVGAAWIRAFALRDWSDVFAWLPDMRLAYPMLAPDIDSINQAWLPWTKRHLALHLALKAPGLVARLSYSRGMGIVTGATTQNFLAFDTSNPSNGNWWCPEPVNPEWQAVTPSSVMWTYWYSQPNSQNDSYPNDPSIITRFPLGALGDGGKELAAVQATGSSTERMANDAVAWAADNNWFERLTGGDADLPETLHLAVRATRYACRHPANNSPWSRAAYVALHEHFPNSVWAAQTPYWFGNMTKH